jgi:predicted RNA-binding Zn ribbon-like protein
MDNQSSEIKGDVVAIPRNTRTWVHEDQGTPAAPGELELLRSFLSLHEHPNVGGTRTTLSPTPWSVAWWLVHNGLVDDDRISEADADRALSLLEALRTKLEASIDPRERPTGDVPPDEPTLARATETLDEVARGAGLELRFSPGRPSRFEPTSSGVDGALGRLLVIAHVSEITGTWSRLKECRDETCRSVFFDRSKNHSGRWCSMETCGNRNKARAWRERRSRA